jgi:hypothetical protein
MPQALNLQLPAGLPAGTYRLEMAPLDGQAIALGATTLPPDHRPNVEGQDVSPLPEQVTFDGTVQLLGYDLKAEGTRWQLDLLWRALAGPPQAKVFVHVVDASGAIVAQQDVLLSPLPNSPASSWAAGDLLRQRVQLDLHGPPPPDGLRVYIGLYYPETGQRLALMAGDETVPDGRYRLDIGTAGSP